MDGYGQIKDDVTAPEVGRSEDILKLYEKYANKFKKTEDDNYIYLDYSGDVSKDFNQVGKAQQTFADIRYLNQVNSTLNR